MIHFDLPKERVSIVKVIGIGGGGCKAVNHLFLKGIEGVNFIVCNTDEQALGLCKVPNKIQLGINLTQGLGAIANPLTGRKATEESINEIQKILEENTKVAFITAGMGGGTGTGGAPVIAKLCRDLGILTIGVVTTPFYYEGKKRITQAEEGISLLKNHVDTLIVISNDKLREQFGNLGLKEAFAKADDILSTAVKCVTDVINSTGQINVDFADICTVLSNGGNAIFGSASAKGINRALKAIESALNSPLLKENIIYGAKWILINVNSAEGEYEFTMDEVEIIENYLMHKAGDSSDIILGLGYDNSLGDYLSVTLIVTGYGLSELGSIENHDEDKIYFELTNSTGFLEYAKKVPGKDEHIQLYIPQKPIPYLLIEHLNKEYNHFIKILNQIEGSQTKASQNSFFDFIAHYTSKFFKRKVLESKQTSFDLIKQKKNSSLLLLEKRVHILTQIEKLVNNEEEIFARIGSIVLIKTKVNSVIIKTLEHSLLKLFIENDITVIDLYELSEIFKNDYKVARILEV